MPRHTSKSMRGGSSLPRRERLSASNLSPNAGWMYSINMDSGSSPYRCRMCGASSYRRLVQRGPDGAMGYGDLYRCSGCSVTFTDPSAWRQGPEPDIAQPTVEGPPDKPLTSFAAPSGGSFASTWGMRLPEAATSGGFARTEEDCQGIRDAAARANRSKGRRG